MTLYKRFLRQAKEQIALQNLTQAEVGRVIGLSRNGVSKALRGEVILKGDKLLQLAMTLRISIDEIIFPETDLVVDSMTMAQGLASAGVPEEEILQGIRNSAHGAERAQLQAAHYNKLVKHVRDQGCHMPYFPKTIEGGFSGDVSDEIAKACERHLESERAAEKIAVEEDLNRRRRELEELKRELEELKRRTDDEQDQSDH